MNMNLKKVISTVAALAMSLSCFTAFAASFTDVADTYAYKTAIDDLIALKIVNGYDDGTFKPDNEITRAEVTKMVVAALGQSYTNAAESSTGASDFTDTASHWASGYISVGVAQGFINGMGDGTFSPDTNVTYAQIVKMLVSILGYTTAAEANGGYPSGYTQIANSVGVTANVTGVSQDTAVTRGQVAQLIDNALATPIVAVTSWTTDIYGKPVAVTEIMDGNGDSEKYQTLLTESFNTYKVRGRVTATHAQGTVDKDQVQYQIEYSDNYDDDAYDMRKNSSDYLVVDAYFGNTDAENLLFTYSEALIMLDDNDEATLLSIVSYGRNDVVELAADDYDSLATDGSTIDFTISSSSSKTKSYKLDSNVEVYVNGVNTNGTLASDVTNYIDGNDIGTVTLIDTPQSGSSSKDGYYDYIMVSKKSWGVVDSTTVSGTVNKIYLSDSEDGIASISLDDDDDDFTYSITKDGADVEFSTIVEDNVVLVTYDVTQSRIADSNFITIELSDTVVEGKVSQLRNDDNEYIYTIDGTEYTYVADGSTTPSLTTGNEYVLYLDAEGRIVKYDESSSSKNYAVIDRVYLDNNSGDYKARIIKADGTRASYVLKDGATEAASLTADIYTGAMDASTLEPMADRVVTYKLNSSSEMHTIAPLTVTVATGEFNETSTRIGSARMTESTQIVDLTKLVTVTSGAVADVTGYSASDIKAASLSSFVDGEEYAVYYGDRTSDGNYRFVIILDGNASIGVTTHFAVIDSVSEAEYEADASTRTTISVYNSENKDALTTLFVDEDLSSATLTALQSATRGTVVVYGTDGDGVVTDINVLYQPSTTAALTYAELATQLAGASYNNDPRDSANNQFYLNSGVAKWDDSTLATSNGYARVSLGAIVDKNGSNVTVAQITGTTSQGNDVQELSVASDVNVYVLDYNYRNSTGSGRLSCGTLGSVIKTMFPSAAVNEASDGSDIYDWAQYATLSGSNNMNYAYFKTVDEEITDILVVIPAE